MLLIPFYLMRLIVVSIESIYSHVFRLIRQLIRVHNRQILRCCVLVLLPVSSSSYSLPESPQGITSILVLGDSISAGYGMKSKDGWVNLLQEYLSEQHANPNTSAPKIINASISGETTGGALARLPNLLEQYQPNVVIVELGGNDGLRGHPIKTLRQNLNKIVEFSRAANAEVLIVGMRIPPNYGKRYNNMFYNSFQQTAKDHNVALVPFLLDNIAIFPQLMQKDGIHPTALAQPKILENVLPELKKILEKL